MARQDHGRQGAQRTCADDLFQALRWIFAGVRWRSICFREDCTWTPWQLAVAALLWAWSDEKTLGDRFAAARKITHRSMVEQDEPAKSYQAFMKLLRKWTTPLLAALSEAFRQREAARAINPRREGREKFVHDTLVVLESGKERDIDIARHARFAPALHRQPADKAEWPTARLAKALKTGRRG
jgi:hypothetical protein